MNLTYKERQELNELSKKAFGSSSRWQKLITKGVAEPLEISREVMVPNKNGGPVLKTFVDKKKIVKHYTVESVKTLMEEVIAINNRPSLVHPPLASGLVQPVAGGLQSDGSTVTLTDNTPNGTVLVSPETFELFQNTLQGTSEK